MTVGPSRRRQACNAARACDAAALLRLYVGAPRMAPYLMVRSRGLGAARAPRGGGHALGVTVLGRCQGRLAGARRRLTGRVLCGASHVMQARMRACPACVAAHGSTPHSRAVGWGGRLARSQAACAPTDGAQARAPAGPG